MTFFTSADILTIFKTMFLQFHAWNALPAISEWGLDVSMMLTLAGVTPSVSHYAP
jgi:hypothetical protein